VLVYDRQFWRHESVATCCVAMMRAAKHIHRPCTLRAADQDIETFAGRRKTKPPSPASEKRGRRQVAETLEADNTRVNAGLFPRQGEIAALLKLKPCKAIGCPGLVYWTGDAGGTRLPAMALLVRVVELPVRNPAPENTAVEEHGLGRPISTPNSSAALRSNLATSTWMTTCGGCSSSASIRRSS